MQSGAQFGLNIVRNYTNYESCYCPYHNDNKPSAIFLKNEGVFYCYGCHTRKTLSQLASDFDIDYVAGPSIDLVPAIDLTANVEVSRHFESVAIYDDAISYLESRGIEMHTALKYELEWDAMECAIVFPMVGFDRRRIGYVERSTRQNASTRYSIHGLKTPVWPMPQLAGNMGKQIVLSEGPFKAMAIAQAATEIFGSDNNVLSLSIMGSRNSKDAVNVARQCRCVPIFIVDADAAGQKVGQFMKSNGMRCFMPHAAFDDATPSERVEMLEAIFSKL